VNSQYGALRDERRSLIESFVEVYVDCPFEVCKHRDVKGMYSEPWPGNSRKSQACPTPAKPSEASARKVVELLISRVT
jgi:adenylylsulfate kinase